MKTFLEFITENEIKFERDDNVAYHRYHKDGNTLQVDFIHTGNNEHDVSFRINDIYSNAGLKHQPDLAMHMLHHTHKTINHFIKTERPHKITFDSFGADPEKEKLYRKFSDVIIKQHPKATYSQSTTTYPGYPRSKKTPKHAITFHDNEGMSESVVDLTYFEFITEVKRDVDRAAKLGTYLTKRYPSGDRGGHGTYHPGNADTEGKNMFNVINRHLANGGKGENFVPGKAKLKDLIPTQYSVNFRPDFYKEKKSKDNRPILVAVHGDKKYIYDGHHRRFDRLLRGEKETETSEWHLDKA